MLRDGSQARLLEVDLERLGKLSILLNSLTFDQDFLGQLRATAKSLTREIGVPFAALAQAQRVTHVGRDVLRPPRRGSICAHLQTHLDFAVALGQLEVFAGVRSNG
jgi:hypothetical protein